MEVALSNPVQPRSKGPAVGPHEARLSIVGGEPGIVTAFAILRDSKEYVPTRLTIQGGTVTQQDPCGPKGIYESTAYEYLMAAVMDHYRLKGLKS